MLMWYAEPRPCMITKAVSFHFQPTIQPAIHEIAQEQHYRKGYFLPSLFKRSFNPIEVISCD